ncbi:MAG: hypothetical protein J6N72_03815 [Psychrobacter sp.]|nr:hypothetical protein [Psychrobacter sp.]
MSQINQKNFNAKVERRIEIIAVNLVINVIAACFVVIFLLLVYGATMDVVITQKMIIQAITPVTIIGICCRIYIAFITKNKIEIELASSIGYNKAQMQRVLKNPNYKEHTGDW